MDRKNIADDLQLAGYIAEVKDDRLWVEGESDQKVEWVIEEDFDAWWLYEYTGRSYYSVDAFGSLEEALKAAKTLCL
jgi:hypothetical protein